VSRETKHKIQELFFFLQVKKLGILTIIEKLQKFLTNEQTTILKEK
jgi:hypothetical protein